MEHKKSIRRNFIMNTLLQGTASILPFLMSPYVSRILQPAGMGSVSFANSILTYFTMFAMLGVPVYGVRSCAKVSDDREELSRTVHEIFIINVIMGVISYALLALSIILVPRFRESASLIRLMSIMIALNIIGMDWVYKGLEEYSTIAVRSIIVRLISFIAVFILVRKQEDGYIYGVLLVISAYGSNLWNFLTIGSRIETKKFSGYDFRRHLRPVAVFFAMSVATVIYTNLDQVMLGLMRDDIQVGYYDAAVKIKNLLIGLVSALGLVMLPRISYCLSHGEGERFEILCRKAFGFILRLSIPLAVYFVLFSDLSIYLFSGPLFSDAVPSMRVLTATILFIGMTNVIGIQMLVPLGREREVLKSEIAGAVTDLVINLLLIPKYGALGAAIGTLIAEITVFAVQIRAAKEYLNLLFSEAGYLRIAAALIPASALCLLVRKWVSYPLVQLFLTFAVFMAVYCALLLLLKDPLALEEFKDLSKKLDPRRR